MFLPFGVSIWSQKSIGGALIAIQSRPSAHWKVWMAPGERDPFTSSARTGSGGREVEPMGSDFGPLALVLVHREGQGHGLPGAAAVLDPVREADAVRAALLLGRGERTRPLPIVQLGERGGDALGALAHAKGRTRLRSRSKHIVLVEAGRLGRRRR